VLTVYPLEMHGEMVLQLSVVTVGQTSFRKPPAGSTNGWLMKQRQRKMLLERKENTCG
jgi:hypothetical protein